MSTKFCLVIFLVLNSCPTPVLKTIQQIPNTSWKFHKYSFKNKLTRCRHLRRYLRSWICIVFLHLDQMFSKQFLDIANAGMWISACLSWSPDLKCEWWTAVLCLFFWVSNYPKYNFCLLDSEKNHSEKSLHTNVMIRKCSHSFCHFAFSQA